MNFYLCSKVSSTLFFFFVTDIDLHLLYTIKATKL